MGLFYTLNMAENKKSFVLYSDLIKSIEHLTNEEKGILFNHLLEYVNDMNPVLTDRLVLTAWKPIELQLKRDLVKFEEVKSKRSDAGKRSAELRALKSSEQNPTNPTSVESVQQTSTNPTVNDTVNVNDNVINTIPSKDEFIAYGLSKLEDVSIEALGLKYEAWLSNNWSTNKNGKETKIKNWKTTLNNTLTYLPKQPKQIIQQKSEDQIRYEHVMKQMELNKTA